MSFSTLYKIPFEPGQGGKGDMFHCDGRCWVSVGLSFCQYLSSPSVADTEEGPTSLCGLGTQVPS